MSGLTSIRLAALVSFGYAVWVLAGRAIHLSGGTQAVNLRLNLDQPVTWLVGLLALVIALGLWMRHAWAWWLGLAAALFQGWRMAWPQFAGGTPRLPGAITLGVLALLLVFLVLLFMPKARATCNR